MATTTQYLHDNVHWLHLPRLTETVDRTHPKVVLAATRTCYDGDTSPGCNHLSAHPRGLPTTVFGLLGKGCTKTAIRHRLRRLGEPAPRHRRGTLPRRLGLSRMTAASFSTRGRLS